MSGMTEMILQQLVMTLLHWCQLWKKVTITTINL